MADSPLISTVDSLPVEDPGLDLVVYTQGTSAVAMVAASNTLTKVLLGAGSRVLTTWSLASTGWVQLSIDSGVVYVTSEHSITIVRPLNCSSNEDMGSCVRDITPCAWCHGDKPRCVPKNACKNKTLVYEGDEPYVLDIKPLFMPSCGNTFITMTGSNLDMANEVKVTVGSDPCVIVTRTNTYMTCLPPTFSGNNRSTTEMPGELNSTFIGNERTVVEMIVTPKSPTLEESERKTAEVIVVLNQSPDTTQRLTMVVNALCPRIDSVWPKSTIRSGGIKFTIFGENLDNFPNPIRLHFVTIRGLTTGGPCEAQKNGSLLVCVTPPVRISSGQIRGQLMYSQISTNNTILHDFGDIQVKEDPMIAYSGTIFETTVLKLEGQYIDHVNMSEIQIHIFKTGLCDVFLATDSELQCRLPNSTPTSITSSRHITVMIGENIIYFPGYVSVRVITSLKEPITTTVRTTTEASTSENSTTPTSTASASAAILGVTFAALVVLVVIVVAVICVKRRRRKRMSRDRPSIVSYSGGRVIIRGDGTSFNMAESSLMDSVSDTLDEPCRDVLKSLEECGLIIKRDCLKLGELIGKGNFGSVYKGFIGVADKTSTVAIKTLHSNESGNLDEQQFLQEAFVMKEFHHENVMTLVGICVDVDSQPLVILPFMEHGDLLSYLHDDTHIPTVRDLVSFGLDIAEGMTYLASLKFVHRDLAARNCMLDANYRVKVADFGLSRDIYETSYYSTKHKGTKLPVKWMALESLMKGVFNEKTDVWSYGITVWELMTRGVRPYATVDNWDMERYLKSGRRLPQPIYCPANLYKLMRKCWSTDPDERPEFVDLRQCIRLMLARAHHQLAGPDTANIEETYVNIADRDKYVYENEENF